MGRQVPEVALLLAVLACKTEAPPPPSPPKAFAIGAASQRALAEAPPTSVVADLGESDEVTALLDAYARAGRFTWTRGSLAAPGLVLRAGSREETLVFPSGPIDLAEVEAGITTRLLRLAHGRKTIGVTVGHGETGWEGLSDPELGLATDYRVVKVEWGANLDGLDALVVDGPHGRLPLENLRRFGRPVLYLVDSDADPALLELTAVKVVPGALVDPVNGSPVGSDRDGGIALAGAPLAQVLAAAPGDPLAHLHYVSMPFAVALVPPDSARPILRTSPRTQGVVPGARVVAVALEGNVRTAVVGSAELVGAARLALHRRLGTEVTAGGFRAVSRLVDWLVADVTLK